TGPRPARSPAGGPAGGADEAHLPRRPGGGQDPPCHRRHRAAGTGSPARRRDHRPAHRPAGFDRGIRMSRDDMGGATVFDALMAEVMAGAARFGHREHVHLTWLAVRRCGVVEAVGMVSDGIQRTARYARAPQKYHATVSRASGELVGYHMAASGESDFPPFAGP